MKIDYEIVLEENQKFKNGETYIDLRRKSIDEELKKRIKGSNKNNLDENDIKDESIKKLNEEFKKMENNYRELIKNKDEEYNNNLKFIEKDILEKEQEYDNMKIELNKLENKNKELENYDLKKTNQDLQNSLLDALSKNEELTKDLSKYQNKNKSNFQNNNIRNISIQTEQIVTDEVKKKLINLNITMSDIMENRFYEVILDLVNLNEKFKQGNVVFGGKYGMIIDNSNDNNKKGEEININERY